MSAKKGRPYGVRDGHGKRFNDGSRGGEPLPMRVVYLRLLMQGRFKGADAMKAIERIIADRNKLRRQRERELRIRNRPLLNPVISLADTACADKVSLQLWTTYMYLEDPRTRSGVRLCFVIEGKRYNKDLTPLESYEPDHFIEIHLSPSPKEGLKLVGTKKGLFWVHKNNIHAKPQKLPKWDAAKNVIDEPHHSERPAFEPTPASFRPIEERLQAWKATLTPEQQAEHERKVKELLGVAVRPAPED